MKKVTGNVDDLEKKQLFIPCNSDTKRLLSFEIPDKGKWLPPIIYKNGEPIIDIGQYRNATIMSGAQADEAPAFELETYTGIHRYDVEERLISLAEKSLKIDTEWTEGKIISNKSLLNDDNNPFMPEL